ncbi:hypothetical protein ACFSHT_18235 [Paraburkholderia silviterrae]|uniref:Uncharacterized protein n=1 Tax=Paraburkholderia silviterrae TaxID=2528715 RepID=A0A4R5M8S2_9BURK|nr:hypothetical protein [Paraburkholderia silviterrae]TDG22798.1 hypothetical protein EYW47_16415 [Paraburkholderia silviterrae]
MTLSEKEQMLRDSVALPTAKDWALLGGPQSLVEDLNAVLARVMQEINAGRYGTLDEIAQAIYRRLKVFDIAYPEAGVTDLEARITVARFMAINYHPGFFHYFQHFDWEGGNSYIWR